MKVFKFGGASVKNAASVINVFEILKQTPDEELCVVFSAMGKTTNLLEKVADAWVNQNMDIVNNTLFTLEAFHRTIADELGISFQQADGWMQKLNETINTRPPANYDEAYDAVVHFGEFLSTAIISTFLSAQNYSHFLLDATQVIKTENKYRDSPPDWDLTLKMILKEFEGFRAINTKPVVITQGFVGSNQKGKPVTLGREGSDFSAAIFAWALQAVEMIIWKDVPGVLNADPRYFEHTIKLDRMTYRDAIELSYYGASVIHPKTIQPLQSKQIPLYIKSFYQPDQPGTIIQDDQGEPANQIPCFIFKSNQVLVSISPRDFSFIAELNLHNIFGLLANLDIHINMMQHSAISFSIVMDENPDKLKLLLTQLQLQFRVKYNTGLQMITIRYYDQPTIDRIINNRPVLLEQKSRTTVQLVVNP